MRRLLSFARRWCSRAALADSDLPPAYWANRQLPDARQEARAEALMEQIRCLVCQGQSIADSDAELAGDMRDSSAAALPPASARAVRVADPALRPLDQLQADRRAGRLAGGCRRWPAAGRRVPAAADPDEASVMGWLILLG